MAVDAPNTTNEQIVQRVEELRTLELLPRRVR